MRVGVIGSGRIGGNAGARRARARHEVTRRIAEAAAADIDRAAALAAELRLPD